MKENVAVIGMCLVVVVYYYAAMKMRDLAIKQNRIINKIIEFEAKQARSGKI